MALDSTEQVKAFFETLWPDGIRPDERILIWTLPDKMSMWATGTEGAATVAARQGDRQDVYVGCALGPAGLSTRQRALNTQVLAIPGLWADIDYSDSVHKKKNLPSREEAEALIAEIGTIAQPTMVIHSGHGYQAWWCFTEPWRFTNEDDRRDAGHLEKRWVDRIRGLAQAHGWDVDATVDLARVMRVPGTINHKNGDYVAVTLELANGPRHAVADLIKLSPPGRAEESWTARERPIAEVDGPLVLDVNAQPPFDKYEALMQNEPKFRATWERKRKDIQDRSPSSWDMALANYAVAADWTHQEVVDLLIASRRKHGDDLKLRDDYYRRTIQKATIERTVDRAAIVAPVTRTNALGEVEPTPELPTRDQALAALSDQFFNGNDVRIESLTKFNADPPTYVLYLRIGTTSQAITLGRIDNVIGQRAFRAAIAATANILIPEVNKAAWEKRVQALLNILDIHDIGNEGTPAGQAEGWIAEYLDAHPPVPEDQAQSAIQARRPYHQENYLYLNLNTLSQWLHQVYGERITRRELARYMRMAGYEQHTVYIEATAKGTPSSTRSMWRRPLFGAGRPVSHASAEAS